jgi:hypothetical protein
VGPCPPTAHETQPALVRSSEEDASERDEKQCEGPRRWMTGARARMASSVMGSLGPPWMMVKEPATMYARLLLFNVRFRFHLLLL